MKPDPLDPFPCLETPRLVLRPVRAADAPALLALFSDPETLRYWGTPPLHAIEDALDLVYHIEDAYQTRQGVEWALTRRGSDELVGKVCHHTWDQHHCRSEIGYAIGVAHRQQGLATEALRAILAFGFGPMRVHRCEAHIDPQNLASRRTLERLGFTLEARLRENFCLAGRFHDSLLFSRIHAPDEVA